MAREKFWESLDDLNVELGLDTPRWSAPREKIGAEVRDDFDRFQLGRGFRVKRDWTVEEVMGWIKARHEGANSPTAA